MSEMRNLVKGLAIAMCLITLLYTSYAYAQSGIEVRFKVYTKNIFGWEATHVKTIVHAILADPNTFDKDSSYARHEAWVAWWCFTCYAYVTDYVRKVSTKKVGEDTHWVQGSWNAEWSGWNHVWVYAKGSYHVHEKVYYDVDGAVNKVADAIKNAIKFIVDVFKALIG